MNLYDALYKYPWIVPHLTKKLYYGDAIRVGSQNLRGISDPLFINSLWRGNPIGYIATHEHGLIPLQKVILTDDYFSEEALQSEWEVSEFGGSDGFLDRRYRTQILIETHMLSTRGAIHEARQRWMLNDQLAQIRAETGGSTVPVLLGNTVYRVRSIVDLPENTQKADMMGVDNHGTPVLYLSYKDQARSTPQQWGGVSQREPKQWESPEVQAFIFDVAERREMMRDSTSFYFRRSIQDPLVKLRAMYGSDYHPKRRGPNSVHAVVVGDMRLHRCRRGWELVSDGVIYHSGKLPNQKYMPTLAARFDANRHDGGIPQTRIGIFPYSRRGKILDI